MTAYVCIALLGILVFGLGLGVSLNRGRADKTSGYDDDPSNTLHKWVRSHGNTTEYAPMLAVLMAVLATRDHSTFAVVSMIGATASRYLIAIGLIASPTLDKPHPLRLVGALGTYVFGLALCGTLLRTFLS